MKRKEKKKKYNKNDEAFEYFSTMHIQTIVHNKIHTLSDNEAHFQ